MCQCKHGLTVAIIYDPRNGHQRRIIGDSFDSYLLLTLCYAGMNAG
jgi:hypothetical protein